MNKKISPALAFPIVLAALGLVYVVYNRLPTGMVVHNTAKHFSGGHMAPPAIPAGFMKGNRGKKLPAAEKKPAAKTPTTSKDSK